MPVHAMYWLRVASRRITGFAFLDVRRLTDFAFLGLGAASGAALGRFLRIPFGDALGRFNAVAFMGGIFKAASTRALERAKLPTKFDSASGPSGFGPGGDCSSDGLRLIGGDCSFGVSRLTDGDGSSCRSRLIGGDSASAPCVEDPDEPPRRITGADGRSCIN